MDKEEVIQSILDAREKSKISNLKKDVIANADPDKIEALMLYNAMIDNINFGINTTTVINHEGVDWKLRLLGADELMEIRIEAAQQAEKRNFIENSYIELLLMKKILVKALSPSPFKTEPSKTVWSETDLGLIPHNILEGLFKKYIFFVDKSQTNPTELSEEEFQQILDLVKKNTDLSNGLDRPQLLAVTKYLLPYCASLEKMLSSATGNKSS